MDRKPLEQFTALVPGFDSLSNQDKIRHLAWWLHEHDARDRIDHAAIVMCFRTLSLAEPNVSAALTRLHQQGDLVRAGKAYKLEGALRRSLTEQYGEHPTVIAVSKVLSDLPGKVPRLAEKEFLVQTLNCYRIKAYRAAIVMAWNLAFSHLLEWILADAQRLAGFNTAIAVAYPKRKPHVIARFEDFEEFKEFETIEVCRVAKLCSKNIIEILREKLKKRNAAAHPSMIVIGQHQADDVITDLVNNVVLALT